MRETPAGANLAGMLTYLIRRVALRSEFGPRKLERDQVTNSRLRRTTVRRRTGQRRHRQPGGRSRGAQGGATERGGSGERVHSPGPEGTGGPASPLRPAGETAGATGPGGAVAWRHRRRQALPLPVRLLPYNGIPVRRLPRIADPGAGPEARPQPVFGPVGPLTAGGPDRAGGRADADAGADLPSAQRLDQDDQPLAEARPAGQPQPTAGVRRPPPARLPPLGGGEVGRGPPDGGAARQPVFAPDGGGEGRDPAAGQAPVALWRAPHRRPPPERPAPGSFHRGGEVYHQEFRPCAPRSGVVPHRHRDARR